MGTMDDWYALGPGRGTCKRCGEDRLIDEIADARGIVHFCRVCSHDWKVSGPLTLQEYRQGKRWPTARSSAG